MSETVAEQVLNVRKNGGFKVLTDRCLIKITGKDAASYINTQTSNEVTALGSSAGQYNNLLDRKAHLKAHFSIHRTGDIFWIITEKDQGEVLQEHLEKFHFTEDFAMEDVTGQYGFILLQGSISQAVVEEIVNVKLSEPAENMIFSFEFHNLPLLVISRSETAEPGFLLLPADENSGRFREQLIETGKKYQLGEITDAAFECLRIEAGIPRYGIDMTEENLLPETGLEKISVSYTKGCYLGQEVVARVKTYGTIPRALIGLEFEGKEVPPFNSEIIINGKKSGTIKSGVFSPALGKPVALAYIIRDLRKPGESLEFTIAEKQYKAVLKLLPFYHPLTREEQAMQLYETALTVFARNQEEEAVRLLEEAIGKKPDFADAYESLGVILSRLERYEEAIDVMTRLTEVAPDEPMARTNLSIFYMKIGNKDEAETQMAKATALKFTKAMKENKAKKALEAKKQEDITLIRERMEMFKEVLETEDPDDLIANYGMGKSYFDLEQYQEALPYFEKAIEVKKDYSMAYLFLGKGLEFTGEKEKARDIYKTGITVASQKGDLMPLKEMEQRKYALEK
jgi:folate-binding protein YgfZ